MVYIRQHAYPEKLKGWIFIQILLILSVESVSSELLAIIKMENIENSKTDTSKNGLKSALGKINLCI